MIKQSYVLGVQDALVEAGVVKYATEEAANNDASVLTQAMDKQPIDENAMAQEGVSQEGTTQIANAIVEMAQEASSDAQAAQQKAQIASQAAQELVQSGAVKTSEVVAGHAAGSVAAGESVAKNTDLNKELANAVPNTAEREDKFSTTPGQQADGGKGAVGTEEGDAPAAAAVAKTTDHNKELANAIPNTAEREDVHGAAGTQSDADKGHVGTEEKQGSLLERLAKL